MARKKATDTCVPAVDRKWEVEDALRTLNRAEEIRRDKKMMGDVKRLATEQIQSLSKHIMPEAKKPAGNALMGKK